MTDITLEFTNDRNALSGQATPVDTYIEKIAADAQAGYLQYVWEMIPTDKPSAPTFKILDAEEGFISELHRTPTDNYVKYTWTTVNANGIVVYSAAEWCAVEHDDSVLGELYIQRTNCLMEQEDMALEHDASVDGVDPADDSSIVDRFVLALLRDARAPTPTLHYERRSADTFVCESFGISETHIVLTKESETDHSDRYKVSLEYPDATDVIACTEVSKLTTDSSLRELYNLIEQQHPETEKDIAIQDVERFIDHMAYREFLGQVLDGKNPSAHADMGPDSQQWLVMDIIKAVPMRCIARRLLDELSLRKGALPAAESRRLRQLIESTITAICNVRKEPTGEPFAADEIQHYAPQSINRLANAWTNWPAKLFGSDVDMQSKTVLMRCAVVIIAAVLADQL